MVRDWIEGEQALQYEETEAGLKVLQWKGTAITAQVPAAIDGAAVTAIGRKAFLSNKRVQEVWLPDAVTEIGDWAFAYCDRLVSLCLPKRPVAFGRGVFLQCEKLERIILREQEEEDAVLGTGRPSGAAAPVSGRDADFVDSLLAAAVHKLDAPYLLDLPEAGSVQWLEKWDARLLHLLYVPDREGFSKMLLCGEEDYGSKENDPGHYMSQKRRGKARLAMLRLLHDKGLSEQMRGILVRYLCTHTKGCEHEETWQVVKEEYGLRKEYYDLLLDIGALTEHNYDAALCDMGTELAEMKAYLLREKEERFGSGGFFDSLSLEL